MESFDVYFFYNSIRFNKKELYKAAVIKKTTSPSKIYNVLIDDRLLQNFYGPLHLFKMENEWMVDYVGDVDLFNLKMEITEAIEMYESYSNEYV